MKKILILGHRGMLGNAVYKYFSLQKDFRIETTNFRFPNPDFLQQLQNTKSEYIVNCIGKIPQKKPKSDQEYKLLNIDLPIFLESLQKKIIHPSTDCEFSGEVKPGYQYTKRDQRNAKDVYGQSKALISEKIENQFKNTKIIRVSIIGHELKTNLALLNWFLAQTTNVNGYTNHYWNGITTLEWAKICENIIQNWKKYPKLNQCGTKKNKSKFELLNIIKKIYKKDIKIKKFKTETTLNKCLKSDQKIKDIKIQLQELKDFYSAN